jgi:hypothetical protein
MIEADSARPHVSARQRRRQRFVKFHWKPKPGFADCLGTIEA